MKRSGPILAEQAEERIDRRATEYALWERGAGADFAPPPGWIPMTSPGLLPDVAGLVRDARVVTLAAGSTKESLALLDAVVESVRPPCRLYVFGDRGLEHRAELANKVAAMSDRALVRLGPCPPADWLTVDGGREGRLFVGPDADSRRWAIPVKDRLARSLFSAFRTLFWFQAKREALPGADGSHAFRPPLDAPFENPGNDVVLPAGRLRIGAGLDDSIADAEVRISPSATDPRRAPLYFLPPRRGDGRTSVRVPGEIHDRGGRAVWTDTGLPATAVSRKRMTMDMTEGPVALRLEWPADEATALLNCLEDAARCPDWEFHAARRLDEIANEVLLDGESRPAGVKAKIEVNASDVTAPLQDFDAARPARFPDSSPLALEAIVKWRRVPARTPADARPAKIVEDWTKVDEWARRVGDDLRSALESLEQLGDDDPPPDCGSLSRELADILEAPPSDGPDWARDVLARLVEMARRVNEMTRAAHDRKPDGDAPDRAATKKSSPGRRKRERKRRAHQARVDASARPPVPEEALPEPGKLYEHGGERLLEISTWEQLGRAIPVAKRLGARLVAARADAVNAPPR